LPEAISHLEKARAHQVLFSNFEAKRTKNNAINKKVIRKCVLDLNFAPIKGSVFLNFFKKSNSLYPSVCVCVCSGAKHKRNICSTIFKKSSKIITIIDVIWLLFILFLYFFYVLEGVLRIGEQQF
jgi:hypothetical protein